MDYKRIICIQNKIKSIHKNERVKYDKKKID